MGGIGVGREHDDGEARDQATQTVREIDAGRTLAKIQVDDRDLGGHLVGELHRLGRRGSLLHGIEAEGGDERPDERPQESVIIDDQCRAHRHLPPPVDATTEPAWILRGILAPGGSDRVLCLQPEGSGGTYPQIDVNGPPSMVRPGPA
jgi:hypothetical protein